MIKHMYVDLHNLKRSCIWMENSMSISIFSKRKKTSFNVDVNKASILLRTMGESGEHAAFANGT